MAEYQKMEEQEQAPRPPSYTEQSPAVAYPGVPAQQVVYNQGAALPNQGYIIQNVPVAPQSGCCSGKSDKFQHRVGMTTGILQIFLAAVSIVVSSVNLYYEFQYETAGHPGMGAAIGGALILFLPAGILGACSKNKNNGVIIAYLVMSILAAIEAVYIAIVEGAAAAYSSSGCSPYDHAFDEESSMDWEKPMGMAFSRSCVYERFTCVFAMHIVVAVVAVVEFIVAIVAAAICCGGLRCCCNQYQPAQQSTVTMMQYYQPMQPAQPQTNAQAMQVPVKS